MVDFELPVKELKYDAELPLERKDLFKLYNLPKEVKFCTKCGMSNQRPRITFDKDDVCSACRFYEKKDKKIDWDAREKELWELCDKIRSKDGSWDILIPGSGGKDSAIVSHILKYKFKTAHLFDINHELILVYKTIKADVIKLIKKLTDYQNSYYRLDLSERENFFYVVREEYNNN